MSFKGEGDAVLLDALVVQSAKKTVHDSQLKVGGPQPSPPLDQGPGVWRAVAGGEPGQRVLGDVCPLASSCFNALCPLACVPLQERALVPFFDGDSCATTFEPLQRWAGQAAGQQGELVGGPVMRASPSLQALSGAAAPKAAVTAAGMTSGSSGTGLCGRLFSTPRRRFKPPPPSRHLPAGAAPSLPSSRSTTA